MASVTIGVVSLGQNLLPSRTPKEGVRGSQKAFRLGKIFQTAGIGTIYGLLFAGLLFAPLPHVEAATCSICNTGYHFTAEGFPHDHGFQYPTLMCAHTFANFFPAYQSLGTKFARGKRDILINRQRCQADAKNAAWPRAVACLAGAGLIKNPKVRKFLEDFFKSNHPSSWSLSPFPGVKISPILRTALLACLAAAAWKFNRDMAKCHKTANRAYGDLSRRINDELEDLIRANTVSLPAGYSAPCASDLGCCTPTEIYEGETRTSCGY